MNYDIKDIIRASNIHYGIMFPKDQKGDDKMTFDTVRLLLILIGVATDCDIDDYTVYIYSLEPLRSKTMVYKDIPDCFNCKVYAFDIDLDKKIIFIRSEVVKHGKI